MYYKLSMIVMALLLGACSTVHHHYREFSPDRDTHYLDAYASGPLELPEGIHMAENQASPYIIPAGRLPGLDAEPMNLVPPGGLELWNKAQAELEKTKAQGEEE